MRVTDVHCRYIFMVVGDRAMGDLFIMMYTCIELIIQIVLNNMYDKL